jgi:hypothetical protein
MSEDSTIPTDKGVNFENFRIVGFDTYYHDIYFGGNFTKYDHWLYGYCNNDSDIKGISYLINQQYFEKSACIRKYYSTKDQKYYNTDDPKFKWPVIAHGTYNPNYKIYNIIIESCKEDTIDLILGEGSHCKEAEFYELNQNYTYFGAAYIYFINNFINIINYEKPKKQFIDVIEGMLYKK